MALAFSEKAEAHFQDLLTRYPNTLAALLPTLHLAQDEFGWISVTVMDYVAERLDLHPTKVLTAATFYSLYDKQPVGKVHIQVCTTLTCAFRGGYELLEHLEQSLGIRTGETTADGNFTVSEVECLASCGTAPMFYVSYAGGGNEYFENLSVERVNEILEDFNKRLPSLPNPAKMH